MAAETLSARGLNRATLARQLLLERSTCTVVEAVERTCGLQAQEARPPFLGLWSRLEGFRREQLARALQERQVVRATLMRGTLHLASARDFGAFRAPLQPVLGHVLRALGARAEGLDVPALLPVARELLHERPRTFSDLRALLAERFPDVDERALGFAVRMHLPLVLLSTDDPWSFPTVAAFTRADEWLGTDIERTGDIGALITGYLAAFGPASAADVQAFTGLTGVTAVLDELRPELMTFRSEQGRELFDVPDGLRPPADTPAPVRLLPEFDSLVLAHADRSRVVADEHRGGLVTKNLRVRACFLVDGMVAGTWTSARTRRVATLELAPFAPLATRVLRQLTDEAERLLRFSEPESSSYDVRLAE